MRTWYLSISLSWLILFGNGCINNTPQFPREEAKVYLEKHSYKPGFIGKVMNYGKIEHQDIVKLSKAENIYVRYMLASNPRLNEEERDLFLSDESEYVRSGLAINPNLSSKQIEKLFNDESPTVYGKLAENKNVPPEILIKLYKERHPSLLCFAANPNCPEEIKAEIRKSGDKEAKYWMRFTEEENSKK